MNIKDGKYIGFFTIIIFLTTFIFLSSILFFVSFSDVLDPLPPSRFSPVTSRILFFLAVIICTFTFLWGKRLLNPMSKLSNLQIIILLFVISVLLSLPLIIFTDIIPKSDFGRYYRLATEMSQNETITFAIHAAAFPHTIIFPAILSIIFKVFGPSVLIAQLTGLAFSSLSVVLVYLLGKQFINSQYGFLSATLWLFMPTRIFYSVLVCTENVFNALALLTIFLFIKAIHVTRFKISLIFFTITGVLFAFLFTIRPNGIIILIACMIIYLFLISKDENLIIFGKPLYKFLILIVVIIFFILSTSLINFAIKDYLNIETSDKSYGWSIYIGMNKESNGHWNMEDDALFWELINEKGPVRTQDILFSLGIERFDNLIEDQELIPILFSKTTSMWYASHDAYDFVASSQELISDQQIDFQKNQKFYTTISNGFYYVIVLLSIISLARAIIFKERNMIMVLSCLVLLGTIAFHLPIEVQMRYKNHALIWLVFISAFHKPPTYRLFDIKQYLVKYLIDPFNRFIRSAR